MDDAEFRESVRRTWWRTPFKLARCLIFHRRYRRDFLDWDTGTKTIVIVCDKCRQYRLPWRIHA